MQKILNWYAHKGWQPLSFQLEAWEAYRQGMSGLISVPTGAGKTYAAFLGPLQTLIENPAANLKILYITPLKALARDLEIALRKPIDDLNLPFKVEIRTGDTAYSRRLKQLKTPPQIVITTPESLSLLLSDPHSISLLSDLDCIIGDEWHELIGSKRGVMLELCLGRLKKWNPQVKLWGITATIGNLAEAAQIFVGKDRQARLITAKLPREIIIDTILPESVEKLPWAGQLGMRMLPYVLQKLDLQSTTLIFTNTRSQAERWHRALLEAHPEWQPILGLHHSSIDRKERERIEQGIKHGEIKIAICTSSLDLGVDFPSVEHVMQIGSPKSIARLIQRAGRSSHKPMTPCHISLIPTHALELAELKGYRLAVDNHIIEARHPLEKSYDVLLQHLVTCAIGGGFDKQQMLQEIRSTNAFSELTDEEWESCLLFLTQGGKALTAYPEYKKIHLEHGLCTVTDPKIIQRHRMNIGTITSDPHVVVKLAKGTTLGIVEENFLASLNPGDHFLFGGRLLQLISYQDMTAYVRLGKSKERTAAIWQGSRLPFSAPLGALLRQSLDKPTANYPEAQLLDAILQQQQKLSALPNSEELLLEYIKSREGWHLFCYPFEGKLMHQGLASLLAHRLSKLQRATFTISSNDYGLELLSSSPFMLEEITAALFTPEHLELDIKELLNIHELAKGNFRDIARIAGLVFQGYPGSQKTNRQLQVSSSLLYEVFSKYEPDNLLLAQARKEVLEKQLELVHLKQMMQRLSNSKILLTTPKGFTPFSLPLFIERVSGHMSTETLVDRIEKIKNSWKKS